MWERGCFPATILSAAPQTVQTASPVCGTKNFSSVRLYSAPQLHCTIVAIPGICASDRRFSSPELCHVELTPLHAAFQTKITFQTRPQRTQSEQIVFPVTGCCSRRAVAKRFPGYSQRRFCILIHKSPALIGSRTPVKSRILLDRGGDCRFLALNSKVLVNQTNEEASPNADERRFD